VVPRIAGGEITPEKLMVIGEVAKKFDLYTKVREHNVLIYWSDLKFFLEIWRILIDNGFESGHAWKIIRAVKKLCG
jgi:nitrite reductase (NADH) large subunit